MDLITRRILMLLQSRNIFMMNSSRMVARMEKRRGLDRNNTIVNFWTPKLILGSKTHSP